MYTKHWCTTNYPRIAATFRGWFAEPCLSFAWHLQSRATPSAMTEPYTFLSGKPVMPMDSSTSMKNDTYLLTLQANCDKGKTQRRRDHSELFCLFASENLAKELTNQSTPFTSMISKQKQTHDRVASRLEMQWAFQTNCIDVGSRPANRVQDGCFGELEHDRRDNWNSHKSLRNRLQWPSNLQETICLNIYRVSAPSFLVFSITVSDFLSCSLAIPFSIVRHFKKKWPFWMAGCQAHAVMIFLLALVSLTHQTAISTGKSLSNSSILILER